MSISRFTALLQGADAANDKAMAFALVAEIETRGLKPDHVRHSS